MTEPTDWHKGYRDELLVRQMTHVLGPLLATFQSNPGGVDARGWAAAIAAKIAPVVQDYINDDRAQTSG